MKLKEVMENISDSLFSFFCFFFLVFFFFIFLFFYFYFFILFRVGIFNYGQYLRYMVYHATKPMQMLGIFSYQSILQYTCLLREPSQQSRVKVAHVEDPSQSHKWQLMKSL